MRRGRKSRFLRGERAANRTGLLENQYFDFLFFWFFFRFLDFPEFSGFSTGDSWTEVKLNVYLQPAPHF
jgi:hypothetical protein